MRLAALLLVVAACSSDSSPSPTPSPTPSPNPNPSPTQSPPEPESPERPPLVSSRQLVLATVDGWDGTLAELRRFERGDDGRWKQVGAPWQGIIGARGSAWGIGAHGDIPPRGDDGPVKKEGDGKSPAGVFSISAAYGYAATPPAGTRVPYHQVDKDWLCIDDKASRHYNEVLDTSGLESDWSSHEDMRRNDDLYRWVLDLDHNPHATPGAGSCIFLQLWHGPDGGGTAGCTSMPRESMEALLAWLDPAAQPLFVLLPADRAAALRAAWALP